MAAVGGTIKVIGIRIATPFTIMSTQLATKALHAGHDTSLSQGTRAVPIYQSTSYVFNDSDHAANLFTLSRKLDRIKVLKYLGVK